MTATTAKATGKFAIKGWDEQPWAEQEDELRWSLG